MKATDLKIGETYYYVKLAKFVSMRKMTVISISDSFFLRIRGCEGRDVRYENESGFIYKIFIPNNPRMFDSEGLCTNCENVLQSNCNEFITADKPSMVKAIKGYCYKRGHHLYGKQLFLKIMNALKTL